MSSTTASDWPPMVIVARGRDGSWSASGAVRMSVGHRLPRDRGRDDGIFAEWAWDGSALRIEVDRYGIQPVFYAATPERIVASTSLVRLATALDRREVEAAALATFLHLGFFVGEDTPLKGVCAMPPGGRLRFADGVVQLDSSRPVGAWSEPTRDEAIDGYIERFRASMARRLPDSSACALPLSGGKDSRHILFELVRQGAAPSVCITSPEYPPKPSVDIAPARAICERLGLRHEVVTLPSRYEAESRKNAITSLCSDEHEWMMGLADRLNGSVATSWDGIAGDVLSASLFQTAAHVEAVRSGRLDAVCEELLGRDTSYVQEALPERLRCAGARDAARERVRRSLASVERAANPVTMFYFWNRTRREIGLMSTAILGGVPVNYCPFLDHDVFDYLAGLPPAYLSDKSFHHETIARAFPELADLPYAPKGGTVPAGAHYASFAASVAALALRRRPSWMSRAPRLAQRWIACGLSASRRRTHRWLSPARLLYVLQLETLLEAPEELLPLLATRRLDDGPTAADDRA